MKRFFLDFKISRLNFGIDSFVINFLFAKKVL